MGSEKKLQSVFPHARRKQRLQVVVTRAPAVSASNDGTRYNSSSRKRQVVARFLSATLEDIFDTPSSEWGRKNSSHYVSLENTKKDGPSMSLMLRVSVDFVGELRGGSGVPPAARNAVNAGVPAGVQGTQATGQYGTPGATTEYARQGAAEAPYAPQPQGMQQQGVEEGTQVGATQPGMEQPQLGVEQAQSGIPGVPAHGYEGAQFGGQGATGPAQAQQAPPAFASTGVGMEGMQQAGLTSAQQAFLQEQPEQQPQVAAPPQLPGFAAPVQIPQPPVPYGHNVPEYMFDTGAIAADGTVPEPLGGIPEEPPRCSKVLVTIVDAPDLHGQYDTDWKLSYRAAQAPALLQAQFLPQLGGTIEIEDCAATEVLTLAVVLRDQPTPATVEIGVCPPSKQVEWMQQHDFVIEGEFPVSALQLDPSQPPPRLRVRVQALFESPESVRSSRLPSGRGDLRAPDASMRVWLLSVRDMQPVPDADILVFGKVHPHWPPSREEDETAMQQQQVQQQQQQSQTYGYDQYATQQQASGAYAQQQPPPLSQPGQQQPSYQQPNYQQPNYQQPNAQYNANEQGGSYDAAGMRGGGVAARPLSAVCMNPIASPQATTFEHVPSGSVLELRILQLSSQNLIGTIVTPLLSPRLPWGIDFEETRWLRLAGGVVDQLPEDFALSPRIQVRFAAGFPRRRPSVPIQPLRALVSLPVPTEAEKAAARAEGYYPEEERAEAAAGVAKGGRLEEAQLVPLPVHLWKPLPRRWQRRIVYLWLLQFLVQVITGVVLLDASSAGPTTSASALNFVGGALFFFCFLQVWLLLRAQRGPRTHIALTLATLTMSTLLLAHMDDPAASAVDTIFALVCGLMLLAFALGYAFWGRWAYR
ncbi:MAG: hypothetical protein MHM6MM_002526 [Cercozoa sp. M6MM]